MTDVIEALISGGKATAGPPIGPALGPLGVNIKQVVDDINEKTKDFDGMQIPVKIIVDDNKNIEIEVGTPPTSALILGELEILKGTTGEESVGDISIDQLIKIAKVKKDGMLSYSLKNAVKEVIGTCVSVGVTVEGSGPKEIQAKIDEGEYNKVLSE